MSVHPLIQETLNELFRLPLSTSRRYEPIRPCPECLLPGHAKGSTACPERVADEGNGDQN